MKAYFYTSINEFIIYFTQFFKIVRDTLYARKYSKYINGVFDNIMRDKDKLLSEYPDLCKTLDYIQASETVSVFNDDFEKKYSNSNVSAIYDKYYKSKYIILNNKKLYYPRSYRTTLINELYRSVLIEQDLESPHRYLDPNEDLKDAILFDCGSAEANFTFEVIDQIKHAYLFEGEDKWIAPLNATFEPWRNKVTINKAFLGKRDGQLSLRNYIENLVLENQLNYDLDKVFIKMDIEGAEIEVIEDLIPILAKFKKLTMAVCVYHRSGDEEKIKKIIPDSYSYEVKNGYMLFLSEPELPFNLKPEYPYFRHGVIKIKKK